MDPSRENGADGRPGGKGNSFLIDGGRRGADRRGGRTEEAPHETVYVRAPGERAADAGAGRGTGQGRGRSSPDGHLSGCGPDRATREKSVLVPRLAPRLVWTAVGRLWVRALQGLLLRRLLPVWRDLLQHPVLLQ